MNHTRIYRLYDLITEKFGENKFKTGCEILLQWINAGEEPVNKILLQQLHGAVHSTNADGLLTTVMAKKIMTFFGLQRGEELFTYPEHTPKHFKELTFIKKKFIQHHG